MDIGSNNTFSNFLNIIQLVVFTLCWTVSAFMGVLYQLVVWTVSAFMGALYLDQGLEVCNTFCKVCFYPRLKVTFSSYTLFDFPCLAITHRCQHYPFRPGNHAFRVPSCLLLFSVKMSRFFFYIFHIKRASNLHHFVCFAVWNLKLHLHGRWVSPGYLSSG